jgi:carbonic anhydrase
MVTKLLVGHERFRREFFQQERGLFDALAAGKHEPTALLIGCCDARVVPHVIMGADPGELFILRNIANLCRVRWRGPPPPGSAIRRHPRAQVPHVIVCGHTHRSGIRRWSRADGLARRMPTLAQWLDAEELRDGSPRCGAKRPDRATRWQSSRLRESRCSSGR